MPFCATNDNWSPLCTLVMRTVAVLAEAELGSEIVMPGSTATAVPPTPLSLELHDALPLLVVTDGPLSV